MVAFDRGTCSRPLTVYATFWLESVEYERSGRYIGSVVTERIRVECNVLGQVCRLRDTGEYLSVFGRKGVIWESLNSVCWRSFRHPKAIMMRCRQLKQRCQFPPLLLGHRDRPRRRFYLILIQIDQHKIIFWKLDLIITTFNADNVRAGSFDGSDKSRWKYRNENARPSQWVQQLNKSFACKMKHRCV